MRENCAIAMTDADRYPSRAGPLAAFLPGVG